MNLAVLGSGGREHAICYKLKQSQKIKKLICIPGNAGTQKIAENIKGDISDFGEIYKILNEQKIDIVIVVVAMTAASFVQSSVGFGLALVSGPFLLLLNPHFFPGPMLATALVNTLLMVRRERQSIDIRGVAYVMIGRIPGTFVAAIVLTFLTQRSYDLIFAAIIILSVGLSALGWRVSPTPRNSTIAGFAAGLMGTISSRRSSVTA